MPFKSIQSQEVKRLLVMKISCYLCLGINKVNNEIVGGSLCGHSKLRVLCSGARLTALRSLLPLAVLLEPLHLVKHPSVLFIWHTLHNSFSHLAEFIEIVYLCLSPLPLHKQRLYLTHLCILHCQYTNKL